MSAIIRPNTNVKIKEEHRQLIMRLIQWRENCKKEIQKLAEVEMRINEKA